jgi:hypothetical protein
MTTTTTNISKILTAILGIAIFAAAIPQMMTTTMVSAQQFAHPSDPNDWGNVISGRAQEESMRHSSNPVPSNDPPGTLPQDINRETPRDGVGNVQLNDNEIPKHPAFHAQALCSQFPGAPGCDQIDTTDDPVAVAPQGSSLPTLQQMQGQQ